MGIVLTSRGILKPMLTYLMYTFDIDISLCVE